MTRPGSVAALALAGTLIGAVLLPGAALADGPGYGGTADALTVRWQPVADDAGPQLGVYAVGFKSGSPVRLRVGSAAERPVVADTAGALRLMVAESGAAGRFPAGTSVVAIGATPAGALRTLVGSVPPPDAGTGLSDVAPWAVAVAFAGSLVAGFRRRGLGLAALTESPAPRSRRGRHRPGRHRDPGRGR